MTDREAAYEAWKSGMKPSEIADKYGVSLNTVKSWLSRSKREKGAREGAPSKLPRVHLPAPSKPSGVHPERKMGAPSGNQNAKGNQGGAPPGNTNRLTHGAYCKVFDDLYTGKEQEIFVGMDLHRVSLLKDEIRNLTIRERRLLQRIAKYEAVASGLAVHGVVKEGDKATTTAVTTFEFIKVLEAELTKVQRAKSLNIRMLFEFVEEEDSGEGREDALEFIGALDSPSDNWEDNDAEAEAQAGADEV